MTPPKDHQNSINIISVCRLVSTFDVSSQRLEEELIVYIARALSQRDGHP